MSESGTHSRATQFHIADLTVDLIRKEIRRHGEALPCGRLTFQLMALLARKAPAIVSKEEIAEELWTGRFVSPATLKRRVALLREALGERADQPTYVCVIRGQGYALIPEVRCIGPSRHSVPKFARIGLTASLLIGLFILGAEIGYQDGLRPAIAGHQASTRIVVTSWPHDLTRDEYSFVASTASDFAGMIHDTDFLRRFGAADSIDPRAAGIESLTVMARVINNDAEDIFVTLALPRDDRPDDRVSRETELMFLSRELQDIGRSNGFNQPDRESLGASQSADYRTHIAHRGSHGRTSFMLLVNLRISRQDMLAQPRLVRSDAVSAVGVAIESFLSEGQAYRF